MQKVLLAAGMFLILLVAACSKSDNAPAFDHYAQFLKDSATIDNYLKTNSITASHNPGSIFYKIIDSGKADLKPNLQSNVTVAYTGTFLNGTKFDGNDNTSFDLNGVILGWQVGIPLIGEGGRIQLFLPSYFGYMNTGDRSGKIAPNTVI
ncbi:MAG TPA: FKBP-type peptidyl-prolyl cis-trans isomerase, partial [Chitinophaga sp.]|uniref:FKBP-type peptidyl-prolyl cis-trans isomerase n=1 Tax=Chitinophaga sp. TaxID=1869181 RepID=UPI002C356496